MKRKSIAIFLAASMLVPSLSGTFVAEAVPEETELFQAAEYVTEETEFEAEETETAADLPQVGDVVCGFETKEIRDFDIAGAKVVLFEHQKTGMKLLYVANDDVDRTFNLAFMTEAIDKTGLPHVFEHSTLDGSKKYPSRSLFFNLSYQTYNSFMNAITNPRYTTYPISSLSEEQLLRYADYYTDSCLHPMIMEDEDIYREEAWRYRMEDADSPLTIEGTVYSEMLGAATVIQAGLFNALSDTFPGSTIGNMSGGDPDYIPDMTWESLKDYHDRYYHPSNCLGLLYGQFDDYTAFLDLLDKAFEPYEYTETDHSDENYVPAEGHTSADHVFPVESSSSAEHQSAVFYSKLPGELTYEEELRMQTLCSLINDNASSLMQKLRQAIPYGDFTSTLEEEGPERAVMFYALNVDAADKDLFCSIVDETLREYAENGISKDQVDAAMSELKITNQLLRESTNLGVSLASGFSNGYSVTGKPFAYLDQIEALYQIEDWYEEGVYTDLIGKYLVDNERTVISVTYPEPGLKEEKEAQLAKHLEEVKASMSEEEIDQIIAASNEPDPADDSSEYVKALQAVTVESLPEEYKEYEIRDETTQENVRFLEVPAGVDGVGDVEILLDAGGIETEDLHWLKLLADLSGEIDTTKHTKEELASLISRYFYGLGTDIVSIGDLDEFDLYLQASWIALDENLETAYELIDEMLYSMDFSRTDQIANQIESMNANTKMGVNNAPYNIQIARALGTDNKRVRCSAYLRDLEYYDFLNGVLKQIEEDPASVTARLEKVAGQMHNRFGSVAVFAGNEESMALNRDCVQKFLDGLDCTEIVKQEHEFDPFPASEAIIVDNGASFNMEAISTQELGVDGEDASYRVLSAYVTDAFLYPDLRDRYGVYGVLHGVMREGMYTISYRDPNVKETFDVYAQLADEIEADEPTQEELDGYILSTYSILAAPIGELSGAIAAASNHLDGKEQDLTLKYMKQVKSVTPERAAEYAEMCRKMAKEGAVSTAGPASSINKEAERYEQIINPFGTQDKSQASFEDVPEDHPLCEAVRFAYENNLMQPLTEENFGVDEKANKKDLLLAFYVLAGGTPDVEEMTAFMSQNGIIEADEDLTAGIVPDDVWQLLSMAAGTPAEPLTQTASPDSVTRGELCEMLKVFMESLS